MTGQDNFLQRFKDTYTLNTLPRSVILLGDAGSGHFEVCDEIAKHYDLNLYDISEMISTEYINQIYLSSVPTMYVVDLNKVSEREQNVLLKLFEEPNGFTYVYLYGETTYNIIDTILNRGKILTLDKYDREYLKSLIANKELSDDILNVCTTPGQVEIANHTDIAELKKLCTNMVTRISGANFANTLTISNKINFKDEYGKYDLTLFMKMLGWSLLENNNFTMYKILNQYLKVIPFMNDKRSYFDNFLIKLWKTSRGI